MQLMRMMGALVKVGRFGCVATLALSVLIPLFILIWFAGSVAWTRQQDRTCERADPVQVKLRDSTYSVPAQLRPLFSAEYREREIRRVWGKVPEYCPGRVRPLPQRQISIEEPSKHALPGWNSDFVDALHPVRIFSIDAAGGRERLTLTSKGDAFGPKIFGRSTIYRCWEGYYGPGITCRYDGWTTDGSGISVQMYPKPSDADRDKALKAVEGIVQAFREPAASWPQRVVQ
jgi:hypothetical protein